MQKFRQKKKKDSSSSHEKKTKGFLLRSSRVSSKQAFRESVEIKRGEDRHATGTGGAGG